MIDREALRARLRELGFDAVRFVSAEALPEAPFREWLAEGRHADMAWLARNPERRLDPRLVVPGASTLILLGVNYAPPESVVAAMKTSGVRWARYALHEDYHDTLLPALQSAGRVLEAEGGLLASDYRYYVDTGPVLERAWADRAGLGFVGKNAMLISPDFGNWLFLAALIVRASWEPDSPLRHPVSRDERVGALCGKCTRCLDACPTAALVAPGVLDARRCLSYLTIENKGAIPVAFRRALGGRLYGCDICAEVCPWNRFAQVSRSVLLSARHDLAGVPLRELLRLDQAAFSVLFRRTAIKRIKLAGLLRNACVVAANLGARECLPELEALASHAHPLVRQHAVWAVAELDPAGWHTRLAGPRLEERDPAVLEEYVAAQSATIS